MKFFTQLLQRLNVNNSSKRQQIPTIPPHLAALGFRMVVVECLLGGRFDYYHPEIIAASSDLKGYLEKAYLDFETSPVRDFWDPVRNVWVDVWYGYRGTLEAGLMSYGRQDLIGVVIDALPDEFTAWCHRVLCCTLVAFATGCFAATRKFSLGRSHAMR